MVIYLLLACLTWNWLQIGTDLLLNITSTGDELHRIVNIDDIDWPWTIKIGVFSDFLMIFGCKRVNCDEMDGDRRRLPVNRNCYSLSYVSWALAQISFNLQHCLEKKLTLWTLDSVHLNANLNEFNKNFVRLILTTEFSNKSWTLNWIEETVAEDQQRLLLNTGHFMFLGDLTKCTLTVVYIDRSWLKFGCFFFCNLITCWCGILLKFVVCSSYKDL